MHKIPVITQLESLEARAAGYVGTPGPAGEVQQRATSIIAGKRVEVTLRDGAVHHYEVTARDMTVTVLRARAEVAEVLGE